MSSVGGHGEYADVEEVVWVAEVLAEPLQRGLQKRLYALDQNLVLLGITWRGRQEEEEEEERKRSGKGRRGGGSRMEEQVRRGGRNPI